MPMRDTGFQLFSHLGLICIIFLNYGREPNEMGGFIVDCEALKHPPIAFVHRERLGRSRLGQRLQISFSSQPFFNHPHAPPNHHQRPQ